MAPIMSLTPKQEQCKLSHFNSLPDDIILQIFYQGVFCSAEHKRAPLMALVYSKVCRNWRALTLEASWLWSFIIFNDDYTPYFLTRLYLERSRSAPLIIEINITNINFDPDDDLFWPTEDYLEERMSVFLPHAYRWRSFTCWTDNWAPLSYVVNQLTTVELPLLRNLVLVQNFPDPDDYPPTPLISPFNMLSPPLDRLDLCGVSLNWKHLSDLGLNLSNISLHKLPDLQQLPSLEEFYGIIKNASTNLRKLSLGGIGSQWDFQTLPRMVQPIYLPNIEHFAFQQDDGGDEGCDLACLTKILTMFDFGPKLVSVSLTRFFEDPNFDQFIPVLASKFGRIKYLSIGYMSMTDIQFARWLNVLPNLTGLCIVDQEFQNIAYRVLSLPSEFFGDLANPISCPLLRSLSPCSPYDELLCLVVDAREKAEKPLRSIIWNINHREAVENSINYPYLRTSVEMKYEGVIMDSKAWWVGPDGEYDDIDIWNPLPDNDDV